MSTARSNAASCSMANVISGGESSNDISYPIPGKRVPITREDLLQQIAAEMLPLYEYKEKFRLNSKCIKTSVNNAKSDLYSNVIRVLSKRINDMYIDLFKTYEVDVTMVADYIHFASKVERLTPAFRDVLDDLMESFRIDPKVYIIGAGYVFNECNDIESARRYFTNGINFHHTYEQLYFEEFCMEIKYYHNTEGATHEISLNKYNQIIKIFKNEFNLHLSLVEKVLNKPPFVGVLEHNVVRDMIIFYEQNERMWQKLAKINLEGFNYDFELEKLFFIKDYYRRLSHCFDTYEIALMKLTSPKNNQNIWNIILDEIIELNDSSFMQNPKLKDYIKFRSVGKFVDAFYHDKLQKPNHFIFLADHSEPSTELVILKKSVTVIKESVELWKRLVCYFMERENYRDGMEVFKEGVHILKNDGLPLWQIMELQLMNFDDSTLLVNLYKVGSCHEQTPYQNINWEMRTRYLEWEALRLGIDSARDLFEKLKILHPPCLQLYKDMIHLEVISTNKKSKILERNRVLYSEACNIFGHNNPDVWIDCLKFEYTYGIDRLVPMVYSTALDNMDPELKQSLIDLKRKLDKEFKKNTKNDVIEILDDGE